MFLAQMYENKQFKFFLFCRLPKETLRYCHNLVIVCFVPRKLTFHNNPVIQKDIYFRLKPVVNCQKGQPIKQRQVTIKIFVTWLSPFFT